MKFNKFIAKYPDIQKAIEKIEFYIKNSFLGEMHLLFMRFFTLKARIENGCIERTALMDLYEHAFKIANSKITFPTQSFDISIDLLLQLSDQTMKLPEVETEYIKKFQRRFDEAIVECFGSIDKTTGSSLFEKRNWLMTFVKEIKE